MTEFYTESGLLIATGSTGKTVINERDRTEYYEFEYEHLVRKNIRRKWKIKSEKRVHYIWWESKEKYPIKIYEQKKTVNYADYAVGLFYIDVQYLEKR